MWKIRDIVIPNKLVLAPMAGVTNEAFRVICKEYGAGLLVCEMVSDKGLGFFNEKTLSMIKVNKQEHPISMQIFGSDVDSLVNAAKYIDKYSDCDIIDINMGCPVNKVAKKSEAGAALLKYPDKIYEIVKSVCEAVSKPVTVKIRIGWDFDSINAVSNALLIEKAGASAIAVHGRTRSQFYSGKADLDIIKAVKEAVRIPVIGNGDITDYKSAMHMLDYTKCDAIMIGRASMGNPFIFKEIDTYLKTKEVLPKVSYDEIYETIIKHHTLLKELKGEHLACLEMRSHISWYLKGLPNAAKYKNLINQEKDFSRVITYLQEFFCRN